MENNSSTYNGGPRTESGREASSRNSLKHGCCSESTLILKTENIEDYKALEATWFSAYQPHDDAETRLVQLLVRADWFLERANRTVAEVEAEMFDVQPSDWTDHQHQKLARFTRYQTARTNAVAKARKAIEDYRRNRRNEVIKSEKHEIYKEKNKPEPTLEEILEQLLQAKKKRERLEREEKDREEKERQEKEQQEKAQQRPPQR